MAIVVIALTLVLLIACKPGVQSGETGQSTEGTGDSSDPDFLTEDIDNEGQYAIVRAQTVSSEFNSSYIKFGKALARYLDASAVFKDDTSDVHKYEIIVGETSRIESMDASSQLIGTMDFIISVKDTKIVVCGKSEASTIDAMDYLLLHIENNKTLPDGYFYHYVFAEDKERPLSRLVTEYTIIYDENAGAREKDASEALKKTLESLSGMNVAYQSDKSDKLNEKEILVGNTNREQSSLSCEKLGVMDYTVKISNGSIILCGGSAISCVRATEKFIEMLDNKEIATLDEDFEYTSIFWEEYSINPLAVNSKLFVPNWSSDYTAPAWMQNINEKAVAVTSGKNKRLTSLAHRGDMVNYPENSLEGILSAVMAGADTIEIDVRLTKDNVFVIMHDATLTRTTNFSQKKGTGGLPSSPEISDWTYAELCQLNLKSPSGSVTAYKIPTLYEVLAAIGDSCFVRLEDKLSQENTGILYIDEDCFPIACETDSGYAFYCEYSSTMISWKNREGMSNKFKEFVDLCTSLKRINTLRTPSWPRENGSLDMIETPDMWEKMRAAGKCYIWTDDIVKLCKYISANDSSSEN